MGNRVRYRDCLVFSFTCAQSVKDFTNDRLSCLGNAIGSDYQVEIDTADHNDGPLHNEKLILTIRQSQVGSDQSMNSAVIPYASG